MLYPSSDILVWLVLLSVLLLVFLSSVVPDFCKSVYELFTVLGMKLPFVYGRNVNFMSI